MKLRSISPTALKLFESDPLEFWIKYTDSGLEQEPQTRAMSIGSGFDAFVKNYIATELDLPIHRDLKALFEKQVDAHNLEWCWRHAPYVFDEYKQSGALSNLLAMVRGKQIRMEFRADATVNGIPISGRPDLWAAGLGAPLIHDWKVNGYCSKSPVSPDQGYSTLLWGPSYVGRGVSGLAHKNFQPAIHSGILVNNTGYLRDEWKDQLTMYGWCLGEPVGKEFIITVDQIACANDGVITDNSYPAIRVACHRTVSRVDFQMSLIERLGKMWEAIQAGPPAEIALTIQGLQNTDGSDREKWMQENFR